MSRLNPHKENPPSKILKCRHCGADIEAISAGCYIWEDENGIHTCYGWSEIDFSRDIELEYDQLCSDCFYNPDIEREPSLCSVLFEGAKPGEKMSEYLESHPQVAAWGEDF